MSAYVKGAQAAEKFQKSFVVIVDTETLAQEGKKQAANLYKRSSLQQAFIEGWNKAVAKMQPKDENRDAAIRWANEKGWVTILHNSWQALPGDRPSFVEWLVELYACQQQ